VRVEHDIREVEVVVSDAKRVFRIVLDRGPMCPRGNGDPESSPAGAPSSLAVMIDRKSVCLI
jgi:hypothetical protein